jgi:cytochrome c
MKVLKGLVLVVVVLFAVTAVFAGGSVEKGKALFNDPSLGTNGKTCNYCHPDGAQINGQRSSYTIMGTKLDSIEDAVNFCIKMALKGKPLSKGSQKMKDLVEYLKTLKGKKRKKKIIRGC